MDCRKIESWLGSYRDGELSPSEAGEVSEHLARCPRCRALSRQIGRMGELIRSASDEMAPPFFETRFWAGVARQEAPAGRSGWRHWIPPRSVLAGAAALCLVVLVGLPLMVLTGGPAEVARVDPAPTAPAELRLVEAIGSPTAGESGVRRAPDEPDVPDSWGPGTRIEGYWTQEAEGDAPSRYLVGEVGNGTRLQRASF